MLSLLGSTPNFASPHFLDPCTPSTSANLDCAPDAPGVMTELLEDLPNRVTASIRNRYARAGIQSSRVQDPR